MKPNASITIYLLLLLSLGYIATDIYIPSLPALSTYFNASDHEVQRTLFSFLLSFSLAPLILGPLSDHIGRKKVTIWGIIIGIISTLGCLMASSIETIIFFRFLQGIGMGAVIIASRAMTSDLFTGKDLAKQMSLTSMFMPLVFALAPTIGGILQEGFGWQAVFIFLALYMLLMLLLAALRPESLKHPSNKKTSQILSTYRSHLKNRAFLAPGVNFLLPSVGVFAYITMSPFLFQDVIGLSPAEYGSLAMYLGVVILATGYINVRLLEHFSLTAIIICGSALMVLSGCLLLFFYMMGVLTTWSLLVPALIYFTSMPLCLSNGASKSMGVIHDHFGAASALLTSLQFLGGALATFVFSLFPNETFLPLALCFIAVGAVSLVNIAIIFRQERA